MLFSLMKLIIWVLWTVYYFLLKGGNYSVKYIYFKVCSGNCFTIPNYSNLWIFAGPYQPKAHTNISQYKNQRNVLGKSFKKRRK